MARKRKPEKRPHVRGRYGKSAEKHRLAAAVLADTPPATMAWRDELVAQATRCPPLTREHLAGLAVQLSDEIAIARTSTSASPDRTKSMDRLATRLLAVLHSLGIDQIEREGSGDLLGSLGVPTVAP